MIYALLSVILMTLDYRGGWVERIQHQAGLLVEPIILLIESPFRLASSAWVSLQARQQLIGEIDELREQLADSSARLLLLEEMRRENEELRQLLDADLPLEVSYDPTEIRQIDLNPFSHRVLINRGSADGVQRGQPIVDAHGVVGQVDEVFFHSARVVLLTDPDHALPVAIERTGVRTIAYGSGLNTELRLNDLPMNVDLAPGDRLVTSGLGGTFPAGLPVAQVVSLSRTPGESFAEASLEPLGRLDRSRHLLILKIRPPAAPETEPTPAAESPVPETEDGVDRLAEPAEANL